MNLGLVSPHYVDEQPDWPANYELVGFTHWDGPAGAHTELFGAVAASLDSHGERGLFLTSTHDNANRLRAETRGDGRHGIWPFVPLGAVVGHCRAVVHSGSHRTAALTLAAGLPAAISRCLQDQVWHAHRHEELGVGLAIRGRNLPAILQRLVSDDGLTQRATAPGQRMADEDGAAVACDRIDAFLETGGT